MYIVDKKFYVEEDGDFKVLDSMFDTLDSAKIACLILNAFNYDVTVIYEVRPNEECL